MKKITLIIIFIGWILGLSGDELVKQMETRKTPIDSKSDLLMSLTNKKGKTRFSLLRSFVKDDGKKQIIWHTSIID